MLDPGCGGCPPFNAGPQPCPVLDPSLTATWSTTSSSFTATLSNSGSTTPQGTLVADTAFPGLLSLMYEADHLHTRTSLPDVQRHETVQYDYALSNPAIPDPDECQVRGYISSRLEWPSPLPTPSGIEQVIQSADLEFIINSGGFPMLGLRLQHQRQANTSGVSWTVSESVTATLLETAGASSSTVIPSFPLSAGNFVLDRSVSRGTTQFWMDGNLIAEVAHVTTRVAGSVDLVVDRADLNADIIRVADIALECEVRLEGLRVCPIGTPIVITYGDEGEPVRNQRVTNDDIARGDGVTTTFTTRFPYIPASLMVEVSGFAMPLDPTDPATGAFTLPVPPAPGAEIVASYQRSAEPTP